MSNRCRRSLAFVAAVVLVAALAGAAQGRESANAYTVNPLVSDSTATPASATDASLVNGWGLSAGPTTPWWASDNGTNTSTLYSGVLGATTAKFGNPNAGADSAASRNGP